MNTLLIAEHNNVNLADATVKSVTAAAQMGGDLHVLVAGNGCASVADQAAKLEGVAKVLLADDAQYDKQLAEPMAALVVGRSEEHTSELQSQSTISYAVFCLKKKKIKIKKKKKKKQMCGLLMHKRRQAR